MSDSHLTLPVVTIDPTFASVINDVYNGLIPFDKFWISCYKTSHPSIHAKVHVELSQTDRDLVLLNPVEGEVSIKRGGSNYDISCYPLSIPPTRVLPPVQEYRDPERSNIQHPQRITAFDIAPDISKFATGFLDGSVYIYPTSPLASPPEFPIPQSITTITARAASRPHLSTVTHLQFFPSSRVLLSSGADFSLTILPAEEPTPAATTTGTRIIPARTLRGHVRSITSTAIIGPGRNILSSSLDSTLKLWDVPSSSIISSLTAHSPILSTSLGERSPVPPDAEELTFHTSGASTDTNGTIETPDTLETQSKIVFSGLQNGAFELFDLGLKSSVYRSSTNASAALTSIRYSHERHLLATGSAGGIVTLYDTRALSMPVTSFTRNGSGIEDLQFLIDETSEVGLVVAASDGLPYAAGVVPEGPTVHAELVGGDCDPVRNVRVRKGAEGKREVWSAGDDAVVRRYMV